MMSRTLFSFLSISLVALGCASQQAPVADTSSQRLEILDVNIVDVVRKQIIPHQDIRISGNRIIGIADHVDLPSDHSSRIYNADGAYAVSGLYDAHTHIDTTERLDLMLPQLSGMPVSAADIDDDLAPYMAYGVTGIVELGGNEAILGAKARAREPGAFLPRIISASPILDGPKANNPTHKKVSSPAEGIVAVNDAEAAGHDLIKVYGQLDFETRQAIIERASQLKLPVTGHLPQEPGFEQTIVAGISNIAHAEEITRFWDGEDEDYLALAVRLMAERNVSLTPHLVGYREIADELEDLEGHLASMDWALVPPLARVYASRSHNGYIKDFGGEDVRDRAVAYFRRTAETMDRLVRDAHGAGVLLLAGSDTGNPTMFPGQSLHRELALLRDAGLDGFDVLATATINAAKLLDEADERGTIEEGKIADIVLFDKNPVERLPLARSNVLAVIRNGVIFDRAEIAEIVSRLARRFAGREKIYHDKFQLMKSAE